MKRLLGLFFICLLTPLFAFFYYYYRWKPLWSLEDPKAIYSIVHRQDDTLRIAMIGDSWVGMRTDTMNKLFQTQMSAKTGHPVILKTKGKGGEKSRGIYQMMFYDYGFGTKLLLSEGVDYCVVIAGINDSAANLGEKQFVHHMRLIMELLLANDICPVIVEIPDVNIWNVYGKKPIKDLIVDYIRTLMTGCGMYNYSEYREALLSMLKDSGLLDSIIYVPMVGWNGDGTNLNKYLFLDDQIHLNHHGYAKVDSCIIDAISQSLQ